MYTALRSEFEDLLGKTARFVPAAFHVHSADSWDWPRQGSDAVRNNKANLLATGGESTFLDELAAHYRFVVITDHMKTGYACRLAQAAAARDDITVFPGMEVNCIIRQGMNERVHILVAFRPTKIPRRSIGSLIAVKCPVNLPVRDKRNSCYPERSPNGSKRSTTIADWQLLPTSTKRRAVIGHTFAQCETHPLGHSLPVLLTAPSSTRLAMRAKNSRAGFSNLDSMRLRS